MKINPRKQSLEQLSLETDLAGPRYDGIALFINKTAMELIVGIAGEILPNKFRQDPRLTVPFGRVVLINETAREIPDKSHSLYKTRRRRSFYLSRFLEINPRNSDCS